MKTASAENEHRLKTYKRSKSMADFKKLKKKKES